jgi:O-antigen/teichoic acid export membrane protein
MGGAQSDTTHASALRLLRKGASRTLVVLLAGAGISMLAHLLIARVIGQAEYGVYVLMLSWTGVLAVVAQMGQDTSVVRFLPTYVARGQWGEARGLRRAVGTWVFSAAVVIGGLGCAWVYGTRSAHSATWSATFYIGFAALPLTTLVDQNSAFLRALKHAAASSVYSSVLRKLVLIAALGVALLAGMHADARLAAFATALAILIALAASSWHLRHKWPAEAKSTEPNYTMRPWLIMGGKLGTMSVVIVAGRWLDVLILGAMVRPSLLGAYYAAVQIAALAWYGADAANVILAPMLAERYDAGDYQGLEAVARRAAWYSFLIALACAVLFALIGRWGLGLFGRGFEAGYVPMLILLLAYCTAGMLGDAPLLLSMTRYQLASSAFAAVGVAANCIVAILLIPRLGAVGAALGALSSQCVWRTLSLWFAVARLRINPSIVHWNIRRV